MKQMTKYVYSLHCKGMTDRAIARRLRVHHKTVSQHRNKLKLPPNGRTSQSINMVGDDKAKCSDCKKTKLLKSFSKGRQARNPYYFSYCNSCRTDKVNENLNSSKATYLKNKFSRLRERSKRFNIEFSITWEDFAVVYKLQKGRCFYTDQKMIMVAGEGRLPEACSIDKVIPEKGYVKGNIVFCCTRINTIKSNVTLEEMKVWMPDWYRRLMERI